MKLSLDRAFRLIWLVVGGLVLLFLLIGGVMVLSQVLGNARAGDEAATIVKQADAPRGNVPAIRYGQPLSIRGTATRMVLVEAQGPGTRYEYSSGYDRGNAWANAIFLDAAGARVLLDRPGVIRSIRVPAAAGDARENAADSLQSWITYVAALHDTNGDQRVDGRDHQALYVTDVEGRGLRRVLQPPLRYRSHVALEGRRMLVYALEPPAGQERMDEERMRQRAFIYDVAAGRLTPYAALDSAAARAGQVLAR